jgi:hypothetical protein
MDNSLNLSIFLIEIKKKDALNFVCTKYLRLIINAHFCIAPNLRNEHSASCLRMTQEGAKVISINYRFNIFSIFKKRFNSKSIKKLATLEVD